MGRYPQCPGRDPPARQLVEKRIQAPGPRPRLESLTPEFDVPSLAGWGGQRGWGAIPAALTKVQSPMQPLGEGAF